MSATNPVTAEVGAGYRRPSRAPASIPASRGAGQRRLNELVVAYRPRLTGLFVLVAYTLVAFLIYLGWLNRMEQPLTPESGAGYALGIVGGVLMLLLLLYPLRKHARFMRHAGPVKYWFRTHMLFGVIGPVCILFHSGFRLGSLNSNVAMFCMLAVATSGLVGRYFYTRIHHGLYGRKATLEELRRHSAELKASLSEQLHLPQALLAQLESFERRVDRQCRTLLAGTWLMLSLGVRTWLAYWRFRVLLLIKPSMLKNVGETLGQPAAQAVPRFIGAHLSSIRKVAEFHFYERLFAVWHVLHFPLFLMLLISGIIHVLAVHMY